MQNNSISALVDIDEGKNHNTKYDIDSGIIEEADLQNFHVKQLQVHH